jgi:hypothetical protein
VEFLTSHMALWTRLQGARPFFLMAGPNVIESREHCLRMATAIQVRPMPYTVMHGRSMRSLRPASLAAGGSLAARHPVHIQSEL